MSRRGIHPLLMGGENHQQIQKNDIKSELGGIDSAQRKRFLESLKSDANAAPKAS